jgi:cell division protein FtsB
MNNTKMKKRKRRKRMKGMTMRLIRPSSRFQLTKQRGGQKRYNHYHHQPRVQLPRAPEREAGKIVNRRSDMRASVRKESGE